MFALDTKHLTENHTCAHVRTSPTTHNNTHTATAVHTVTFKNRGPCASFCGEIDRF